MEIPPTEGKTYVVDGLLVEVLGGDGLLNDLLEDLLPQLLGGDVLGVLGRDDNGVDAAGDDRTVVVLVLDGNLGLGVGPEPGKSTITAGSSHRSIELVGQSDGEGEEFGGLVGSISEHDTLVTGTQLLESGVQVQSLGDVGRLLLNGDQDVAGLVVETLGRVIVADVLDGATDDLLVIETGLGGDFTENHDHTGLGGSLASDLKIRLVSFGVPASKKCARVNLRQRVLGQAGVEDGIGNLIAAQR